MYGLLLEAIGDIIKKKYGDDRWEEISRRAGVANEAFATHEIYPEDLIPRISRAAAEVLEVQADEVMYQFGNGFVLFVSQYGYDNILRVLGRHLRDFLNGLDNLHDHMRFSYHKMNAPSFFVEKETKQGLTLHYRTRRRGYVHYVRGQLRQVGRLFYNTDVDITVESQKENASDGTLHVTFRLDFDNSAFRQYTEHVEDSIVDTIPIRAQVLFELFPFHLVFGPNMVIRSVGSAINAVLPNTVGLELSEVFLQTRPIINFCWDEILAHTNNVFELVTKRELTKSTENSHGRKTSASCSGFSCTDVDEGSNRLHLKGQMVFMREWKSIMFLGTPIMQNLEDMFKAGLYINDLSMHDCSRDLVLAGTQQSAELKLALAQEQQKSQLLTASMKKLDEEIRTTDEFVYQMIPKPVADRLRQGESAVNTCQSFDCVTILFSDVVGFTTICSRITPMEVVSMLNAMYTSFDQLSEKHCVYKVETIGDAYMAVAGAPTVTADHAESMCDMALDMLLAMPHLKDPSSNDSMKIRIGTHTGSTVAGVVGLKMPRYCLFGDTVNTASRMESNGEAMKIHISETTRQKLVNTPYVVKERGTILIKGKGSMKTYWMVGRQGKSVRDKKERELQRKAAQARQPDRAAALTEQQHLMVNALPTHRHIYSPVSFDDLAHDPGGKLSPGASPRTSLSHGAGEPMSGRCRRKASSASCPGRKDSLGRSPERRLSGLCPLLGVADSPKKGRKDSGTSNNSGTSTRSLLRRLSGAGGVCKESGETESSKAAKKAAVVASKQEPAAKTAVSTSAAHSASSHTAPAADTALRPTQTVPPSRSNPPSPPVTAAAGRPPDGVILPGGSSQPNSDSDHRNHTPQGRLPQPHPDSHLHNSVDNSNNSNNNSDKTTPVPVIPSSEGGGPSSVVHSPLPGLVNDIASSSQPASESGHKMAKSGRNGRVKSPKNKSERPQSSSQGRKSPHPHKSRSKACTVL